MKILFVNRMAAMVRGGGETFDLQIAEALQRRGHEVEFLSGRLLGKIKNAKCKMKKGGASGTLKAEQGGGERGAEDAGERRLETIDCRPERGDGRPERGDHRPETIDHRPETVDHRQETIDHRREAGDGRRERGDHRPETIDHRREAGDGRREREDSRPFRGKKLVGPQAIGHRPRTFRWHLIRSPYLGWFPWDKVRGGWRIRTLEFRIFEWLAVRWIMMHGAAYNVIQICELPYVVAELKRRGFEKPLVMRLTGPNYDDYGNAVEKADGIIASGTTIATVMKTQRPDAVNVSNCVDGERFRPRGEEIIDHGLETIEHRPETGEWRRRYGIGVDELVLLYVARLQGFKDHDTLIRAFAQVHETVPASRLVLAGSGHMEKDVGTLMRELKLEENVLLLGETDYDELPEIYAASDIKVISSIYESFCFAALEAMATGLPVVTTDNGWVPQLLGREGATSEALLPGYVEPDSEIKEYAGGLVVPKKNPDKLAKAVLQLAGDKEKRKRMGERNRRVVIEQYDWRKSAEILEALYENLLTTKDAK